MRVAARLPTELNCVLNLQLLILAREPYSLCATTALSVEALVATQVPVDLDSLKALGGDLMC